MSGQSQRFILEFPVDISGSERWYRFHAVPLQDGARGVVVVRNDITGRRQAEEQIRQMQRLDALGQLTGGVAHDFNNLLTIILGHAELLEEHLRGNHKLHQWAKLVFNASERGAALTNRLLAFARRQALDPRIVNVRDLLQGMDMLLRRAIGRHVSIRFEHEETSPFAMVDPSQLENAVLNLCLNARDAMPRRGKILIRTSNALVGRNNIRPGSDLEPGPYILITVSDDGEGMDDATLARAFEPFFTTKETAKGSGLGLSMVYGFLRQTGGDVTIASTVGKGTDVTLWLPVHEGPEENEDAPPDPALPSGTETILLCEDDADIRAYTSFLLEQLGYTVVSVASAAQALDILRSGRQFDLLLTDIVMPGGINGRELVEQIAIEFPTLPFLIVTGYTTELDGARMQTEGHLLVKPYRRDVLANMIRQIIDGAKKRA